MGGSVKVKPAQKPYAEATSMRSDHFNIRELKRRIQRIEMAKTLVGTSVPDNALKPRRCFFCGLCLFCVCSFVFSLIEIKRNLYRIDFWSIYYN